MEPTDWTGHAHRGRERFERYDREAVSRHVLDSIARHADLGPRMYEVYTEDTHGTIIVRRERVAAVRSALHAYRLPVTAVEGSGLYAGRVALRVPYIALLTLTRPEVFGPPPVDHIRIAPPRVTAWDTPGGDATTVGGDEVAQILSDIDAAMPRVDGAAAYDLYGHLRRLRAALGLPENPRYPGGS